MTALAPAAIKAALAGEAERDDDSQPGEEDPVTAAGRRLAKRRGWTTEDLDDLMTLIEGSQE
jgi:hypothetical protein